MSSPMVCVRWTCGYYVGKPQWRMSGDWVFEPDTCETEFDTEHDLETWIEGFCTAECPNCGAELTQKFDAPERIEVET